MIYIRTFGQMYGHQTAYMVTGDKKQKKNDESSKYMFSKQIYPDDR